MRAYIAFNRFDAEHCQALRQIPCKLFKPTGTYVPLTDTQEAALDKAVNLATHITTNMEAVTQPTMWYILELVFSTDKAHELCQRGAFRRVHGGWRCHQDLNLADATSVEWIQSQCPPVGLEEWARRGLKTKRMECGSCSECGKQDAAVWQSAAEFERQCFCVECWHSFFTKTAMPGVFAQAEGVDQAQPPSDIMPASPGPMKAYIAFNECDAKRCEAVHMLPRKVFQPIATWVPLQNTQEGAVERALNVIQTKTSILAAKEPTNWYVLELTISAEKALTLFQEGGLKRYNHGWRYYGDLPLAVADRIEWLRCTVPASGLVPWAAQALKTRAYSVCGNCSGCGATNVPAWKANKAYEHQAFCVECWHGFKLERAFEGLYPQLDEQATQQPKQEEDVQPMDES